MLFGFKRRLKWLIKIQMNVAKKSTRPETNSYLSENIPERPQGLRAGLMVHNLVFPLKVYFEVVVAMLQIAKGPLGPRT